MKVVEGFSNKLLTIDLTNKSFEISQIPMEDRIKYLGAKGLGLKLFYDNFPGKIDPLSPENIIVIMPGILMGTNAPCSGRFHAITISPLTGIIGTSSCGGPFGMSLKKNGFDALIIKGKAENPTFLVIDEKGVTFESASEIWGKDTHHTQDYLSKYGDGILAIGPAGEHLVRYANVISRHRFLGRCGFGAVFGSKNLKGIVAKKGEYKILPKNKVLFDKLRKKGLNYINRNQFTAYNYRNYGTSSNVNFTNPKGAMPAYNFRDGYDPQSVNLSGEKMAELFHSKHHTCKPCSILCGHKGIINGKEMAIPEYETVTLLGSNLGIFDPAKIAEWNDLCSKMGLDTISLGGTLAWAMEANEKGIFKSELTFGKEDNIADTILKIAHRVDIGDKLAEGVKRLAEEHGGNEFAIHIKGLEISGYDPRAAFGQALSFATANRGGCHLSAYPVGLEIIFDLLNPYSEKGKADYTIFFENLFNCINSLQTCLFTAFAYLFEAPLTKYTPHFLLKFIMTNFPKIAISLVDFSLYHKMWVAVTGLNITAKEFITAGERIHVLERYMNCLLGVSRNDDILPARLISKSRQSDKKQKLPPIDKMLKAYYKKRGYDKNGKPTEKLLKKLQII
ncbi:aldehyde ferredoxin oxidoreductase family protein [Deferribacter autotrophicus]|uniref:Aldehyde ferredoxin oxidoreductase family protein n=1 Tax=Deferribacter autotrophicus TaxID=500465 RepID=A0A5A8F7Z8_9BACT|nr:aldehyde ferredoxin oxidoreductase family protein [Deferribacter autotrophicus]KAA0258402.1 aldehyde ferredoxin oxidoreductase family protein [Deferribacter autotrophicus]